MKLQKLFFLFGILCILAAILVIPPFLALPMMLGICKGWGCGMLVLTFPLSVLGAILFLSLSVLLKDRRTGIKRASLKINYWIVGGIITALIAYYLPYLNPFVWDPDEFSFIIFIGLAVSFGSFLLGIFDKLKNK